MTNDETTQAGKITRAQDETPDVLPPSLLNGLALAWLFLFGGRALLVPFGLEFGLLTRAGVETFDGALGSRLYLVLLVLTVLVVALRIVRSVQGTETGRETQANDSGSHPTA